MKKFLTLLLASVVSVMSAPPQPSTPIINGKLLNNLNANGFMIDNLDISNLNLGGGGGGTPLTDLTLNVPIVLFSSAAVTFNIVGGSVAGTMSLHTQSAGTVFSNLSGSTATPLWNNLAALKSAAGLNLLDNTSDVSKPISTAMQVALDLKEAISDHNTDITSVNSAIALKASTSTVNTALAAKADITYVDTQDATKQNSWGTPPFNGYIAAGNTNNSLFWVDPTTLGTTNATYSDGSSTNTSTTFTSPTQALFTVNDNGKTITGSGIPASTTITFVNGTTITLSHPATATASGVVFTIQNRFLGAGSGTVTLVSAGSLSPLFSTSVSSQSSTPNITFTALNAGANTFFGNPSNLSAPATTMSAGSARNILSGGNAVGANLLQIADPSAIRFMKINASNGVDLETSAGHLAAIGGEPSLGNPASNGQVLSSTTLGARTFVSKENPLTFVPPFSRTGDAVSIPLATNASNGYLSSSDWSVFNGKENVLSIAAPLTRTINTISIPASSSSISGYLLPADWTTFNNKAPSTRTISTTAPITGGGDLSSNRILSIAASTNSIDGYLSGVDHTVFAAKAPGDSEVVFANIGTTGTWTSGATLAKELASLTATRFSLLPPANAYQPGRVITYYDDKTTGNFGRQFRPQGSTDTLNGLNTAGWGANWLAPFIAGASDTYPKAIKFKTDGVAAWVALGSGSINRVENATDARQSFAFNAGSQTFNVPGTVTAANGPSVTVKATDSTQLGVVRDIDDSGITTKNQVRTAELFPTEDRIGLAGQAFPGVSYTVIDANPGTIDTVRIAGLLTSNTLTLVWPAAAHYTSGSPVTLLDASGTVGPSHQVIVSSNGGDTFNGAASIILDEANLRKSFISDGSGNWSTTTAKTSIQPFTVQGGPNFTIVGDATAVKHNLHANLSNGANNLNVTNPYDGMSLEVVAVQPNSGAAGTLNLPAVSAVSGNGIGVVSLSSVNGKVDRVRGVYDGSLQQFLWEPAIADHTTGVVPATPTGLTATTISANRINLAWTDVATTESGYIVQRANGASATTGFADLPATLSINSTSYSDTTVQSATGYTYHVRAFNSAGRSVASNNSGTTTSAGGPSADILEWHLNDGSGTSTPATIPIGGNATLAFADWTTSTQNGSDPAAFAPTAGMAATGTVTVTPTGSGATTYTYRVWGYKNNSVSSHNASGQAGTTNAATLTNGVNSNSVSWNQVTNADWYRVDRIAGTSPGQLTTSVNSASLVTCASGTCTLVDTGLATQGTVSGALASTDAHIITAGPLGVPIVYSPTSNTAISISFWVKSTFSGSAANIIQGGGAGSNIFTISQQGASKLQVSFNGTGVSVATQQFANNAGPVTPLNDNNWHNVVCVLNNTGISYSTSDILVYYDGNATPRSFTSNTGTSRAGPSTFTSSTPIIGSTGFVGAIDDIRIYARALNPTEINNIFTGNAQ